MQLELGAPTRVALPDVVRQLTDVLRSDAAPNDVLRRFEAARTPSDIIVVARDYHSR